MKNLLYLFLILALASCKVNEPEMKRAIGKLDPNATITIRPAEKVKQNTMFKVKGKKIYDLTPLEVVQQATSIQYSTHYFGNQYHENLQSIARGFREDMKDYEIPALKMLGVDVIDYTGAYFRDLTYAKDVYIVKFIDGYNADTLARIPDEVINAARPLIEQAYNDSNFTEVYRLFDEAFVFEPL